MIDLESVQAFEEWLLSQGNECGTSRRDAWQAGMKFAASRSAQAEGTLPFDGCVFYSSAPSGYRDWIDWANSPVKRNAVLRAVGTTELPKLEFDFSFPEPVNGYSGVCIADQKQCGNYSAKQMLELGKDAARWRFARRTATSGFLNGKHVLLLKIPADPCFLLEFGTHDVISDSLVDNVTDVAMLAVKDQS